MAGELFDVAEPVVFDGFVEEGGVGLVAVVGFGVLLKILSELSDESAIVAGLNLSNAGKGCLARAPRRA